MTRLVNRSTVCALLVWSAIAGVALAQSELPALTQPVNDFARVIDRDSAAAMERMIRALQTASGDVVVVATVDTIEPYGDIREYIVKMFENRGQGVGQRGRDNGLLILLALKERRVQMEVGYDLEEFVPDGFAGEISRLDMTPHFRQGNYGAGLLAGTSRVVERIAARRNVTLDGVPRPRQVRNTGGGGSIGLALFVLFIVINAIAARQRRRGRRGWGGGGHWSGWHSGVGPFGGGFGSGGSFGGGGFGGGFGGFGGGRSGGGGGGGSW